QTPSRCGPIHCGQSSARAGPPKLRLTTRMTKNRRTGVWAFITRRWQHCRSAAICNLERGGDAIVRPKVFRPLSADGPSRRCVFNVLLTFRSFVGNFVENFVDAIHV